jgi:hypothetical protein
MAEAQNTASIRAMIVADRRRMKPGNDYIQSRILVSDLPTHPAGVAGVICRDRCLGELAGLEAMLHVGEQAKESNGDKLLALADNQRQELTPILPL